MQLVRLVAAQQLATAWIALLLVIWSPILVSHVQETAVRLLAMSMVALLVTLVLQHVVHREDSSTARLRLAMPAMLLV